MISRIVDKGWSVRQAAEAAGVSERTGYTWLARHRLGGERRLHDRSSAPSRCPRMTSPQRTAEIERLRRLRMSGPAIARELAMLRSTPRRGAAQAGLG